MSETVVNGIIFVTMFLIGGGLWYVWQKLKPAKPAQNPEAQESQE